MNRAIATMRLALGYTTALPDGWEGITSLPTGDFLNRIQEAFPDRRIVVVCSKAMSEFLVPTQQNIEYYGDRMTTDTLEHKFGKYLWAFSYYITDSVIHMVIGVPILNKDMTMHFAIAVAPRGAVED